ncbi:MAG: ATP-binding cassette domain-containing protein [Hyphomicrobiaceae bacterium]
MPAPFLEIRGLTKLFGGVRAVDELDLTIGADEMRCVIGPNGCGKTTLFNLVTGYLSPTSGVIRFQGRDILGLSLYEIARSGIVRKFQVPSVFPSLTVMENVESARHAGRQRHDSGDREEIDRLLATVRLERQRQELAGNLSHGQKQWLELAMVLATSPLLILLDEPAAGMTKVEKAETVRLLGTIRRETRVSALVIEHDMDFVEALDCPVSVMMMGKMVADGSFAEVREDPQVREAYLGPSHG